MLLTIFKHADILQYKGLLPKITFFILDFFLEYIF